MKNENNLFAEFKPSTYEEWKEASEKLLKGAPFDKKMYSKTPEGIVLRPIYNKEDINFEISLPGYDDYVRGTTVEGNKGSPWKIDQQIYASTPKEFNKLALDALNKGQTALEIKLDCPSSRGIDADKSEKGKVGCCGLSVSTKKDFDEALKGIETDCVEINISTGSRAADIAAILYASQKGKKLSGGIRFDPIGTLAKRGKLDRKLDCAFDEMFALASFNAKNMPSFGAIGVDTMPYSSSGASAVEELAIAMATAAAYLREMLARGMEIDEAAPLVRFRMSLGSDFFMTIAKLRAARVLWAKVVEAFGGSEDSRKIRLNVATATYNKTVYDPYVNMLRTATEAFSGVIGGCDSMTVAPFDEIIRKPDEFSSRISRNQQIILQEECNLLDVIDPAGGSFYLENLTQEVAKKAWEIFSKVEELGGMVKALESGFVQDSIAATFALRKKGYDTRRSAVVGTNMYANMSEKPLEKPSCKCAENAEKLAAKAKEQIKEVSVSCDAEKLGGKIEKLVEAAKQGAGLTALTKAICKCQSKTTVKALPAERAMSHYENLRTKSEEYKKANGFGPKVFLATMGPLVQHKVRADFIRGFFEVAGFEVVYPNGFDSADAAAKAFAESGAKFAVICSTDDTYPAIVPDTAKALKAAVAGSEVYLAGIPAPECEESYKQAGLDGAINIKSNNFETLKAFLTKLGVLSSGFMRKYRRHAIMVLAILAAVITPPDIISMILVVIPLYFLYEFSIGIAARVEKHNED